MWVALACHCQDRHRRLQWQRSSDQLRRAEAGDTSRNPQQSRYRVVVDLAATQGSKWQLDSWPQRAGRAI